MWKRYIRDLYLSVKWYLLMTLVIVLFLVAFFFPALFEAVVICCLFAIALSITDYILLFPGKGRLYATRDMQARFSLGDHNPVSLTISSTYNFTLQVRVTDELPEQFQQRNFRLYIAIPARSKVQTSYVLKPLTRGDHEFGYVICYIKTPLGLLQRRINAAQPASVKVYPSFQQLKKYQLLAMSDHLQAGVKKIRRIGHSMEFEKIKAYVQGDDVRTINWKATARSSDLMVNTFTDTRQQQVYCLIDKGRAMKMPFEGMTLLDYSINASLALLNIALQKQDRAGLISFSNTINDIVPAERRNGQLMNILDVLYRQQTAFKESDYESLWNTVHKRITQRSCLLLFTNFETFSALERQLPYLKRMASRHLLCVIFFQNTLLKQIHETQPDTTEGIYIKTIADRFDYEKRQIVKELRRHGILSILTTPEQLTVDVINKYLELKARHML